MHASDTQRLTLRISARTIERLELLVGKLAEQGTGMATRIDVVRAALAIGLPELERRLLAKE